MQNKKFCLLGATFDTDNMGVSALTAGTIKCILSVFPDAKISLLDYGKQPATIRYRLDGRDVDIEFHNMRFSKNILLKNHVAFLIFMSLLIRVIPFRPLHRRIIAAIPLLNAINQTELFLSIAGGDSFSDIYGMQRFYYITLPQYLILLMRKELVLLPQTIGPFKRRISRFFAQYIISKSRFVFSRDSEGLNETKKLLGHEFKSDKVKLCFDIGFVLDPVKPEVCDLQGFSRDSMNGALVVGLNVSGLLYMGGYTKNNMFGLKLDYRDLVYSTIEFLVEKKNARVLLIPHVFGNIVGSESDSIVCENIFEDLKRKYKGKIFLARGRYNQNEIKYIIGLCDLFIGSRMHACIAALSQNIPAISVSYSRKFIGVMETIGMSSLVIDLRVKTKEGVLDRIDDIMQERQEFHEILKGKMPQVKQRVLNLIREIS